MNPNELKILQQIEIGFSQDDAVFAEQIAGGPRLSLQYMAMAAAVSLMGVALVMLFPVHLAFGVAGYLILVGVGTSLLRRRPMKPADESPLQFFHRLTAGLFRNTTTAVEANVD
jgi:hypothetical protein